MIGGAILVGACLLVLGWASEIVGLFIAEPEPVMSLQNAPDCVVKADTYAEESCNHCPRRDKHIRRGLCYQCWYASIRSLSASATLISSSSGMLPESDCRHITNFQTAAGVSMG